MEPSNGIQVEERRNGATVVLEQVKDIRMEEHKHGADVMLEQVDSEQKNILQTGLLNTATARPARLSAKSVYEALRKAQKAGAPPSPALSAKKSTKQRTVQETNKNGAQHEKITVSQNNGKKKKKKKTKSRPNLDVGNSSDRSQTNDEDDKEHDEDCVPNIMELAPNDITYHTLDNVDYHLIDSMNALMFIPFRTCIYLKGHCGLKVLSGKAEILGYVLEEDGEKMHRIYSPRGYSLLCIRSVYSKSSVNRSNLQSALKKMGLEYDEHQLKSRVTESTILLIQSQNCKMVDYINRLFPSNILRWEASAPPVWNQEERNNFEDLCSKLNISLILQGATFKARFYQEPDVWNSYSQTLMDKAANNEYLRLLVCGGKGVGKSTLLRYTVNRLLKQCGSVLILDFDPGQPEFVAAGCVSATLVTAPLLGPNFTHLQQPFRSYFVSDADITIDPDKYVQSCTRLLNDCRIQPHLMNTPMIINTMGFTSGIGLEVTLDVIRISQPTHVVQLTSKSSRRNFPASLDHDYVIKHPRGWTTDDGSCDVLPEYRFDQIPSAAENTDRSMEEWGFRPSELRNIGLVSYFSQLSTGPEWTLTDAVPYKISWNKLAMGISHESVTPALTMAAFNATLVALCHLDTETGASVARYQAAGYPTILQTTPVMPCLGYGIVRAIDYTKQLIYLISPEPIDRMAQVNCLVRGGINVPETMLLDAPLALRRQQCSGNGPKSRVPYATFGLSAAQPTCMPIKKYNPLFTVRGWKQV